MNKKQRRKEHYKNNPNDIEDSEYEKSLHSKINKLKHKLKIHTTKHSINIRLLKSQMKIDRRLIDMFFMMYPNEARNALSKTIVINGKSSKKEIRKQEIIKEMKLKQQTINALKK